MQKWIFLWMVFELTTGLNLQAQPPQIDGPSLEPQVTAVLSQIGQEIGASRIHIWEKERTAVDQARIMYKALIRYRNQGKDGRRYLQIQYGSAAIPALDAFETYEPQGKDLTIEYMAYHIEETVKKCRLLPTDDPHARDFVYVLPLAYHLVEVDIAGIPNLEKFEAVLAKSPHILNHLTLKPSEGRGRICKNCYLLAIRRQP